MPKYTLETKEALVAKALSNSGLTVREIALESNVGYSTLQKWVRKKRDGLSLDRKYSNRNLARSADSQAPLQHLLATSGLDEQAVGAYCRTHGIHNFQLKKWQERLMKQEDNSNKVTLERSELKALRDENKRLKKDLHRKDRALAETSALLVLKKKANLIWGELGDD